MDYGDVLKMEDPRQRHEAIKSRSTELQADFLKRSPVRAIWSFDILSLPFLLDITFWRANFAKTSPWKSPGQLRPIAAYVDYRMILVNPLASDPKEIGVYRYFGDDLLLHESVEAYLAQAGLVPGDIDRVVIDHMHLQDLRPLVKLFPGVRFHVQEKDLAWTRNLHPVDEMFHVRGGADIEFEGGDGPEEIGESLALIPTPGHTPGHQTLVVRMEEGVATFGENGVTIDNYHPEECRVEGVARFARETGQEVLPIANTFWSAQAQYDSMILEKYLASPYMTFSTAAMSDARRIPSIIGRLPVPRVSRFTPHFRQGSFCSRSGK